MYIVFFERKIEISMSHLQPVLNMTIQGPSIWAISHDTSLNNFQEKWDGTQAHTYSLAIEVKYRYVCLYSFFKMYLTGH